MSNSSYQVIDTKIVLEAESMKDELIHEYDAISEEYDKIVSRLLENWKGRGAEAFLEDAKKVKSNINGIADTLKILCDMLTDCRIVFEQADRALGDINRHPF